MVKFSAVPVAVALVLTAITASAATPTDHLVTAGSPSSHFPQNKQNEPAIAVDAHMPNVLAAGSNDEIDLAACDASFDQKHCPFTPGVGVSGVYFSFNSGHTWTQPTYMGWTARDCLTQGCTAHFGKIGTLPFYLENGLVSGGDPAVAFGPRLVGGKFTWDRGSRLYYANLTSNFSSVPANETFNGFEAIAVSRTDDVAGAAASHQDAWMHPVIISRQSGTTFSDKEQVWADNASSSSFFGNVYVCWARFQGQEKGHAAPAQLQVAVSSDGGDTWTEHPIGAAANNSQRSPLDGCTIRTDSKGNAYVFGVGTVSSAGHDSFELVSISSNGGQDWSTPQIAAGPVFQPGIIDPVIGRPTIDGVAGARSDLADAPSVDIANGAPDGRDATNRIVMTYVSGDIAAPHVFFTQSTNGATSWSTPKSIETAGDRGYYTAPAISPNGSDVYVVYNAFTTPYRTDTTSPRTLVGVMLRASGSGSFGPLFRGAPGDPRGSSQNNLQAEFLGDYVYAAATRTYGVAVWNDARRGADCSAIDNWRAFLRGGPAATRPKPNQQCPATFGNSDIFAGTTAP